MGRPKDATLRLALLRAFLTEPVDSKLKTIADAAACSEGFARTVLRAERVQPILATPLERAALAKMRRDTFAAHFNPSTHG